MELVEKIEIQRAQYLSSLSFKDFQSLLNSKKSVDEQKKIHEKVKSFCETTIKTRGETKRIYSYSFCKDRPNIGGRLFCGNSIQGFPKAIRGFLLGHTTTDIDMKNAHPTLLEFLCKKHFIHCPNLFYYNSNRDDILSSFENKDNAKELFLKAVNDEKRNTKEKNQFFITFDKEMKAIQKELLDLPEYSFVKESVPHHKLYNFYGSAINRLLCITENNVLQSVISVINKRGIEIGVLMFDGLMVYGDFYDNPELLKEIELQVENDFPGLNLKFAYKENFSSIELPEDFNLENQKLDIPQEFIDMCNDNGDYDIAKYFSLKFGHRFNTLENKKCYHFTDSKIWEMYSTSTPIREMISNDLVDDILQVRKKLGVPKTDFAIKLDKSINGILVKLKRTNDKNNICRELYDILLDKNFEGYLNKQMYMLPLKNGKLFNLEDNSISERTIDHKFSYECNVDYVEMTEAQESDMQSYFLTLFCGNEKIMQCLLNALKSSLIGRPMRYLYFLTGNGCNGKSLLFKLIKQMFNKAVDVIDKKVILNTKVNSSLSTEFEKLDKCRIGFVTELDEKDELNCVVIKQITGGDPLDVRGLWKSNETLQPTLTPWVLTNMMALSKMHDAVNDRIVIFPFNNRFEVDTVFETTMMKKLDIMFSYIMKHGKVVDKLEISEEMIQAKEEYKEDNTKIDYLQDFVNAYYDSVPFVKKERITRDNLRSSYNNYLKSMGQQYDNDSHCKFTRKMKKLGFGFQESNHISFYTGLVPKSQIDTDE